MVKLSAIQLTSMPNVAANLAVIEQHLSNLAFSDNHLVVLPECCLFFGGKDAEQLALAKATYKENALIHQLSALAKKYRVNLVAGSIPLYHPDTDKFTNSSCVFLSSGEQIAQYDKIHLFDVKVDDNEKNYLESRYTQAGKTLVSANVNQMKVGLTVCYDLRFPELYRQLTTLGAEIITVPSAFTKVTGQAHWETLLRARAIENQVYIVAAGQQGVHENGRETWGHSMIISPWGEILACKTEGQGSISVDVCLSELSRIRSAIPVAEHNRFITALK
ncbi:MULTISPECIES: carbon-nitrogen hydrolase family protein [Thalassotalea]|uniref:Carbon-nitrogen hydrolase family protein n=1 Tax=Thalassotalea castellviae TaxID=3075612 RepID=A0ABU3A0M1_9GAMM|nr:carbon-nitrogen hydrolase family protein [Thalassotalea sp. W431]MDT0603320.1 carbon-nitrogen hydrolase family protein [Thalassotalea sp. W431]